MLIHPLTAGRAAWRRLSLALVAVIACLAAGAAHPSTMNTGTFDIGRYRGSVVVVDFWASWCKPCRQSIPWLNEMRSRYGQKGLVIVGINVDAERSDAERFLETTPIEFDVVFDSKGELAQRYGIRGMPSTLVFDRDGKLVATHLGFRQANKDAREASLRNLIDKAAS